MFIIITTPPWYYSSFLPEYIIVSPVKQENKLQVIREMRAYKLHLLGISECRWTRCGNRITSTGETIIYSGRNDE
jgi:hypothetical protein